MDPVIIVEAVPVQWKVMMAILVVCLAASFVIGTYTLATTPEEVFTPTRDAWGTLQWPGG